MLTADPSSLLPSSKFDVESAHGLVALGFPAMESVVPAVLEWTQDLNWPVARVFAPFLAKLGLAISEQMRAVLCGADEQWKFSLLAGVVAESHSLAGSLLPELHRFASAPTEGEREEGIDEVARQILQVLGRETEA